MAASDALQARPIVVIKLGGSLLDWPELAPRFGAFLREFGPSRPVVIVGGGGFADVVRRLDRVHGLGEARSHHLALRSLDLSARLLESLLPALRVAETTAEVRRGWESGLTPVLAPRLIMEGEEGRRPTPLPTSWATTTDSIAARVATALGAAELVLLKSASPALASDRESAARLGLVDPVFPVASADLPRVRAVNLRAEPREEALWS